MNVVLRPEAAASSPARASGAYPMQEASVEDQQTVRPRRRHPGPRAPFVGDGLVEDHRGTADRRLEERHGRGERVLRRRSVYKSWDAVAVQAWPSPLRRVCAHHSTYVAFRASGRALTAARQIAPSTPSSAVSDNASIRCVKLKKPTAGEP